MKSTQTRTKGKSKDIYIYLGDKVYINVNFINKTWILYLM